MAGKGSRHRLGLTQSEYAEKLARIFKNAECSEQNAADSEPEPKKK